MTHRCEGEESDANFQFHQLGTLHNFEKSFGPNQTMITTMTTTTDSNDGGDDNDDDDNDNNGRDGWFSGGQVDMVDDDGMQANLIYNGEFILNPSENNELDNDNS